MRLGNRRSQFDCQIRKASIRIKDTRLDQRTRRTRLEAACATAALLEPLRIRLERQRADDLAKEQPRSDLAIDQARVLADPSDSGVLRVHALLNGSRVDVGSRIEWHVGRYVHPVEQGVESRLD